MSSFRNRAACLALSATLSGLTFPVFAADVAGAPVAPQPAAPAPFTPHLSGEIGLEIYLDDIFRADDPGARAIDLNTKIESAFSFHFAPGWTVNTQIDFEPFIDQQPFEDRYFGDISLYVETLNIAYENETFGAAAGKIDPTFGKAWDETPGLYGDEFTEDYKIQERLGFAGWLYLGSSSGSYGRSRLQLNVFTADTTILSESAFTKRGRTRLADGGPSNTERLDSVSLTLDGGEFAWAPGLSYNLGYIHEAAGRGDAGDENGFVAGLKQEFTIDARQKAALIGEVAYFDHFAASENDVTYATLGGSYTIDQWTAALGYTRRDIDGAGDFGDDMLETSLTYDFGDDLALTGGYRFTRVEDRDAHTFGLSLTKTFSFGKEQPTTLGSPLRNTTPPLSAEQ